MMMYGTEQLIKYHYFAELLETTGSEYITDSLTGLIARPYILGFVKSLIADNTPFSFVILDLDNFKFINDTYGHSVGDDILKGVSEALIDYVDGFGIAGRFGGDELLLIDLRDREYADKKAFFNGLYTDSKVLRREYELNGCSPFITGTAGCATFPDDADDFDELFETTDKALYRGKIKGRNCYIIYVEEKHKNIDIRKLAGHGICKVMQSIVRQTELVPGGENKLYAVLPALIEEFGITDLYYTDRNNIMHSVLDKNFREAVGDIEEIMTDDFFRTNDVDTLEEQAPMLCRALKKHDLETVLIIRIGMKDETDGHLICAEPRSHRIWQDDECAVMYFLAKLISAGIKADGDVLPE
ncbi:MAG: GGDEF domain-containing protein [Ruminiclostridium sp.]|nr:GGDEF domain-containing protein [Ruminiclostridium sp.]